MLRVIFLSIVLVAVIVFASVAEDGAPQAASRRRVVVASQTQRDENEELIPPNAAGLPHDCAPQHAVASVTDGKLYLVRFSFQSESREVVANIEAEGEEVTAESILRFVSVGTLHRTWHDLTDLRAMADGAYLRSEELAKMLKEPTKVLLSAKKVDPFWLDMYKSGTIQLIVPASVLKEPIKRQEDPYGVQQAAPYSSR